MRLKDGEGNFTGTGFIEFSSPEATLAALALHGSECAERPINLHFARARTKKIGQVPATELSEKPEGCSTVFVANLPFDIDERAANTWANECGEVTSIRWLNDKATGNFKGCGYVLPSVHYPHAAQIVFPPHHLLGSTGIFPMRFRDGSRA